MRTLLLLAVVALSAIAACGAQVKSLPGFGTIPFYMDTGYITVDQSAGRALYYAFAASQRNASDPFLVWQTGGPGCSSLMAFFEENGPFTMNFTAQGAGLLANPYSWNTVANVLYIESPAFVGFSYSNTSSDANVDDARAAQDVYATVQGFLALYPQYRVNDLYAVGESYGGHYVPNFVAYALAQNDVVPKSQILNLQGLAVGNPWTAPDLEAFAVVQNWWDRAIISESVYNTINTYCSYENITFWIINNVTAGGRRKMSNEEAWRRVQARGGMSANTTICFNALIEGSLHQFGQVDILDVTLDVCNPGTNGGIPDQINYCSDEQVSTYLNRIDVQRAMHVRDPPVAWLECTSSINYAQASTVSSMLPHYIEFLANTSLRVLIYSGDQDAIVPFTGTRKWLSALAAALPAEMTIVNDVHEWYSNTNGQQVAGWATTYSRMQFTTVRGAGHLVPYTQPKRAHDMIATFLSGTPL